MNENISELHVKAKMPIQIGETIRRTKLQDLVGGGRQFGMTSCFSGSAFLLFHDPKESKKYGYDKWEGEHVGGTFSYTGQGRYGDQSLSRNNKSLLLAARNSKPIYLFHSDSPNATLLGEVFLGDPEYRWERAKDLNGVDRAVIVFNLVFPRGFESYSIPPLIPRIELDVSEWKSPNFNPYQKSIYENSLATAERHEMQLQWEFGKWCHKNSIEISTLKIQVDGLKGYLQPDFFMPQRDYIIEAKPSSAREYVRLAIGQVLDYVNLYRLHNGASPRPGLLLPSVPKRDLLSLLRILNIALIVPDTNGNFEFILE